MKRYDIQKFQLESYERYDIEYYEKYLQGILDLINKPTLYNVGDILIAYYPGSEDCPKESIVTSLGFNKKYIVVYVNKFGVPYVKEMAVNGLPTGARMRMANPEEEGIHYELDPEYAEAIIMQEVDDYDPYAAHKQAAKEISDIDAYNKSIRLDTSTVKLVSALIASLKEGDILYQGVDRYITITKKNNIPVKLGATKVHGAALDHKGKSVIVCEAAFLNKVFYKSRPQSRKIKI